MSGKVFIRAEVDDAGNFIYKFVLEDKDIKSDDKYVYLGLNEKELVYDQKPIYAKIINTCGYENVKMNEYVQVEEVYYHKDYNFTSFRKLDALSEVLIIHRNCLQFDWYNE